ncbi:MAG: S8 family serine peptidase [Deltaproteobacteria bacterium]|nr:S8 family serine peptidase [Deltaproteobacteria bacterium]
MVPLRSERNVDRGADLVHDSLLVVFDALAGQRVEASERISAFGFPLRQQARSTVSRSHGCIRARYAHRHTGVSMTRRLPLLAAAIALGGAGCDDPLSGPTGGILLIIRTEPAALGSRFGDVRSLRVELERIVVTTQAGQVTVSTQPQSLTLENAAADVIVAQVQAPVGEVGQVRLFATGVTAIRSDGTEVALDPDEPGTLPSWRNSGWKISLSDGSAIPIEEDELIGVRATLDFDDRLVMQGNDRLKVKPTLPAELVDVTPEDGAGVFADRLTVAFQPGTTRARVDEISAEIDASVEIAPVSSTWYRIKLPVSSPADVAVAHFHSKGEVRHVLPAVNFGVFLDANDDDANVGPLDLARVRDAWDVAVTETGDIGSMTTRVAIVEPGWFDLAHADLYLNIAINQGELPLGLFDVNPPGGDGVISPAEIAVFDVDPPAAPDGVISFRDLEIIAGAPADCSAGSTTIAPCDANSNGRVDAIDLLSDGRWADLRDDDDFDGDPETYQDDLCGWDFAQNDNRPHDTTVNLPNGHAMVNAGIIAAEVNNATDIAGVGGRVSLVPIVVADPGIALADPTIVEPFAPDVLFGDSLDYLNRTTRIDVANISFGWHFAKQGYAPACAADEQGRQTTGDVPDKDPNHVFTQSIADAEAEYAELIAGGNDTLFVVAAGNSAHDIDDPDLYSAPAEPLAAAEASATLVVGAAESSTTAFPWSNHGDGMLFASGGPWVGLSPGGGVLAAVPFSDDPYQGTSQAAPLVAGAAALVIDVLGSGTTPSTVRQRLVDSAVGAVAPSCPGAGGGPLLDSAAAVAP